MDGGSEGHPDRVEAGRSGAGGAVEKLSAAPPDVEVADTSLPARGHAVAVRAAERGAALRRAICVAEGTPLYRGFKGSFSDGQIEAMFGEVSAANAAGRARDQLSQVDHLRDHVGRLLDRPDDPAKLLQEYRGHTHGIMCRNSPWVSTTLDPGVAAHFSIPRAGERGFVVAFRAPDSAIETRLLHTRFSTGGYWPREREVLIPGAIDPSCIDEILEIHVQRDVSRGMFDNPEARVVRRWRRDDSGRVVTARVDPPEPYAYTKA